MKQLLKRLTGGLLAACLLVSTAMAAQIKPSTDSISLESGEHTFSFDITLTTDQAFAGVEFGLKPSDGDVKLQSMTALGDMAHESMVKTTKNGVFYFGFFSARNKFRPGELPIARLTYTYEGTAPRTVSLVSSKIVTIDEESNTTVGDTSTPAFTVAISRVPGGGGGGGGGGLPVPPEPTLPPVEPKPVPPQFEDVKEKDWFYDSVDYVTSNGLFNGISDTLFDPNGTMTRAMMVTVLHRLDQKSQKPLKAGQSLIFRDVLAGQWYSNAVLWASGTGVVNGIGNQLFAPDQNITREQMAAILYRYSNAAGKQAAAVPGAIAKFADADAVSAYAVDAMSWAVEHKLIQGKGHDLLDPTGFATRAEVATILMRYLNGRTL